MTENQLREKVVNIMVGWHGFSEANGKHKQIIDIYNSHKPWARNYKMTYTAPWCAAAVSAAFIKAGLTDIAPTECSCSKMIELYKKMGRWKESDGYVPSPGDVIMYDWDDSGSGDNTGAPDHVGIVVSVSGSTIKIIEGNKQKAVDYRSIKINGKYIRGYCLPDYARKATGNATMSASSKAVTKVTVSLNQLEYGSTGEDVRALQILLNGRGFSCGDADGEFGSKTLAAVKKYQKAESLTQDGVVGKNTWHAILGM